MIRITIEREVEEKYMEPVNYIASKKPTPIKGRENSYDNAEKVQFDETYAVRDTEKTRRVTTTMLKQEIADESDFGNYIVNYHKKTGGLDALEIIR